MLNIFFLKGGGGAKQPSELSSDSSSDSSSNSEEDEYSKEAPCNGTREESRHKLRFLLWKTMQVTNSPFIVNSLIIMTILF